MTVHSLPRTYTPCASDVRIFSSRFMTGTVDTRNSRYTLLKRDGFIVLVKDHTRNPSPAMAKGEAETVMDGQAFLVLDGGHYVLRVHAADGRVVFQSSPVTHTYVLEN